MQRKIHTDTARGVACLLLVTYHVVGQPATGLQVSTGVLRDVNDFLVYIRMPLFTFLSGYVYALRPCTSQVKPFIKGKARRLLVPMLVVGTLFAVVQDLVPGTNASVDSWYTLHIVPYAHFWFVESLFLIFLLVVALERFRLIATLPRFMAVFLAASVLYLFVFGTKVLSLSGSIYLLPFFLAGLACNRFSDKLHLPIPVLWLVWGIGLAWVAVEVGTGDANKRTLAALVFGVSSCALLVRLQFSFKPLAYIGLYSYAIYLFHVFFTGGTRIVLEAVGVDNLPLLFIVGLVAGLVGPIVVEKAASRNRLTNTLLLGKRWAPELPLIRVGLKRNTC